MTVTLPVPTVTTPRSAYADERGRSRQILYTLSSDGDRSKVVLVHASYRKSRRELTATAYHGTVERGPTFTSTTYNPMAGRTVAREPLARFSAAKLEAFTRKVISLLPDAAADLFNV